MKIYCAWCDELIGEAADAAAGVAGPEICPSCRKEFVSDEPGGLDRFLNRLPVPVLLVDQNVGVVMANDRTQRILGKDLSLLRGRLGGEVLECLHARLPGGCGQTVHCQGCQIRRSVTETYRSGRPQWRVPAYLHADAPPDARALALLVSTEKIGDLVLLRIDGIN
jgi:hypothetical protein